MSEFIVSKRMKDVVEFDKTNKKLRFLLDEGDQVYYYKDLETIGISCEYHHNLKKALAHNLVFPTYAEGRQFVRVGIRMKVRMGQSVFVHVSEDIVDKGTLQYHEDMRAAREIVSLLKKCRAKA
ncbi:MAG: hypothetical protein ACLT16_11070 [[Clostridium] innocuum]